MPGTRAHIKCYVCGRLGGKRGIKRERRNNVAQWFSFQGWNRKRLPFTRGLPPLVSTGKGLRCRRGWQRKHWTREAEGECTNYRYRASSLSVCHGDQYFDNALVYENMVKFNSSRWAWVKHLESTVQRKRNCCKRVSERFPELVAKANPDFRGNLS